LLTELVGKRANHTHAAVEKWSTHTVTIGWPAGKANQDSNAIHIVTTSFGVPMKRAQIPAIKGPLQHELHRDCAAGEVKAAGMRRYSLQSRFTKNP